MTPKYKKVWLTLLFLSYIGFNYLGPIGWYFSFIATILIILLASLAWPASFLKNMGIPKKLLQYFLPLCVMLILVSAAYYLINHIRMEYHLALAFGHYKTIIHILFYTLNEEFILGALLLFTLKEKLKDLHSFYISVLVAISFTIPHYVFYRWIFQGSAQGILSLNTLLALFLTGMVRNNLILKTGQIGYSWALHFSWMSVMFGFAIYNPANNIHVSESARFNLFIGNEITVILVLIASLLTSIWLCKKPKLS